MEFIKCLVTSSAGAQKYSLMVQGVLKMWAAWLIQAVAITCGFHLLCVDTTPLMTAVDTVASIDYLGLSIVGACETLWGLARKLYLGRVSAYVPAPANLPTA